MWLRRVYFSTLCVPVLDISVRALSRASLEISKTRHAFLSGESASLGMVVLDMHGTGIVV